MEKCVLFFCWSVFTADQVPEPGDVLWREDGWEIERIIRNEDSTDPGCRLIRTGTRGSRVAFDAHFLAGKFVVEFPEPLSRQGEREVALLGILDTEWWGATSFPAEVNGNRLVADLPGDAVIALLSGWSERGVTELALIDVGADEGLARIGAPGLAEAAAAFVECREALPF